MGSLTVPGMSEAQVQLVLDHLRKPLSTQPILSSWDILLDYLHGTIGHSPTEMFHVLYLDRRNRLIHDETIARGSIDHVPVYPREIARRCITLNASAVIIAHNHPSGDPTPSKADIDMTKQVQKALKALEISLHDHVIIGHSQEISFRAQGLM